MINLSGQKGITLVEVLVATAITGLIAGALGAAIHQFITTSERGNQKLTALNDVRNAGRWLTLDGRRAQSTNLVDGAPAVGSVTLSWTTEGQVHTTTYSLSGPELKRDLNGTVTTVARHVSTAGFSLAGQLFTATLTSTPEGRSPVSEQATYKVWLRAAD